VKLVWLAHTDGGCQITQYKTKSFKQFKELDIKELYEDLPAVNKVYLPGCDDVGDMLPPSKFIKDRSYRRLECSKEF